MKYFDLTGKVALVTGGTAGIGLGMVRGLRDAGARVVITGRDIAKGEKAAASFETGDVAFVRADIAEPRDCAAAVRATTERFGRLDILVNNAGTTVRKRPEDIDADDWSRVLNTNLTGALLCSQAAYPEMKKAGGGKIIMIGSLASFLGLPYGAAYAASKGGIVQMGRALATAWAADNIQVNSILPGWIDTEMTEGARAHNPSLTDMIKARSPIPRWGVPEDLIGLAILLASPASDFITGTAIPVDGGYSMRA